MFAGDIVVLLGWRHAEESRMQTLRHTNDIIGSYVTAGARLHLYGYLDKLQDRALYTNTDSVVFIQPRNRLGGHFAGYINTFLKIKAEASGYPDWVRTPNDED